MPCEIAIVGMACVMPGAPDLETFWANIVDGVDSVTEVSPDRWDATVHFDPEYEPARRQPGETPMSISKWGGFIPDVGFDALRWGIPPASLASIDPAQLLALKAATDALDDAGYDSTGNGGRAFDRDRASVVYATGSGGANDLSAGYLLRLLARCHGIHRLPADLDAYLPELTEDTLPGALTSVISGRVANRLDLGGRNLTVDSACASVLVALEIGSSDLAAGTSDLVLCGGVDLHNAAQDYVSFTAAGALSRSGRCRSFDAGADGMTLAEGAGCIVLKRLADAERDGDRIYAVVEGVAGSSDGRHLGLTAPRQEGQVKALRRAYATAGPGPCDVGLIEAHGTGTPEGDRTELRTMTQVFTEAGARPASVVVGTVKSNIGHIKCAAGIASLIKTAKALYHGVQPPTLHIARPNEAWDPRTSPFIFLDRARPWLDRRRVAGVSAFGFGGTNFHAILSSHDRAGHSGPVSGRPHWPSELVALRARTQGELGERLGDLADRLSSELREPRQADRWRLRDIAAAVNLQGDGPVRLAVVAHDLDDLAAKLRSAAEGQVAAGVYRQRLSPAIARSGEGTSPPAVAFLVPGPTAARPGMAEDLLVAHPWLHPTARAAGPSAEVMMPPQLFGETRREHEAAFAEIAGTATKLVSLLVTRILEAFGVRPERVLEATEAGSPDALAAKIRELAADGIEVFVEVGPGQELSALVERALDGAPHLVVATDQPGQHGMTGLLEAVAQLLVAGVPVDLPALHAHRDRRPERWQSQEEPAGWIVNGQFVRTAAGACLPNGLRPANQAPALRIAGDDSIPAPTTIVQEMAAVTEYLQLVHEVIAAASAIIAGHTDEAEQDGRGDRQAAGHRPAGAEPQARGH